MTSSTLSKPTFFLTEADFRRWLEANHATAPELLEASIDWPQARAGPSSSPAKAGA